MTGGFDGQDPAVVHQLLAETLNEAFDEIRRIQAMARRGDLPDRPAWPLVVLRTPKGWGCPKVVDGKPVEGTWRAHQVPLTAVRERHPPRVARAVDAELPAAGAVRRAWSAAARDRGAVTCRRPEDEREPARQRWNTAARSRAPRLPRVRRGGRRTGQAAERGDPRARHLPPRRGLRQPRQLPHRSVPTRQPRIA